MTVFIKQKQFEVDVALLLLAAASIGIIAFGMKVIEFVCVHNILKGEW